MHMDKDFLKKIRDLPMVVSLRDTSLNKTGAWSLQKPDFSTKSPPCQHGCPAQVPIREIMTKVRNKDFDGAVELYCAAHPFPAITGRVCHHPCQSFCLRREFDDALEIRAIERFLGDYVNTPVDIPQLHSAKQKRIAVVGSGPSGLACSYYLRLQGYEVTVFESRSQPGGLLRTGIPLFRLPESVLDKEITRLEEMGIKFKTEVTVSKDLLENELSQYDAMFLGIGAHLSKEIRLKDKKPDQWLSGLEFLADYEKYRRMFKGKKIAVIGGGNTAMDAARTALRLGAEITVIYRRTRDEMPAIPEEVEGAIEEGCEFRFLTSPVDVKVNEDRIDLGCVDMELGEPDESGRPRPVSLFESYSKRTFDFVISAIGEYPDISPFEDAVVIHQNEIQVDPAGQTSKPFIFAGGDAAGYSHSVVDAMASGKKAANSISCVLNKKNIPEQKNEKSSLAITDLNTNYYESNAAVKIESISPGKRIKNFTEIVQHLSESEAVIEADRCLSCGACTHCDNCVIFCPDSAIIPDENEYIVREEYCKGCGICISECPRSVLFWRSKL